MIKHISLRSSSWIVLSLQISCAGAEVDNARLKATCPGAVAWLERQTASADASIHPEHPSDPKLRTQLLRMQYDDQKVRLDDTASNQEKKESDLDEKHQRELRQIVARHGIPTVAMVGTDGVHAMWTLVQHLENDIELQKAFLQKIESGNSGIPRSEIATLTDKIRRNENQPQIYGSQFQVQSGRFVPEPIADEKNVDLRRAQVGLMPLADYACMINAIYRVPGK